MGISNRKLLLSIALVFMFGACALPSGIPGVVYEGTPTITPLIATATSLDDPTWTPSPTLMPTATTTSTLLPTATPQPTQAPLSLWVAPYLPAEITRGLVAPFPLTLSDEPDGVDLKLDIGDANVITRLIYVLTVPYPSLEEDATIEELFSAWKGDPEGKFRSTHLYLSEATYVVFTRWWGPPSTDFAIITPEDEILEATWNEGAAWALIPFDQLEPRWKVVTVDGDNPIWKSFDPEFYRLSVPVSLNGSQQGSVGELNEALALSLPNPFNRDKDKLTTVVLTGVTALVRATAAEMEVKGIVYPALDIGEMLREADILHISNEVPFAEACPEPDFSDSDLVFCSSPEYMLLLEAIGTDVVELSGDHFGDWGTAAVLYTLELYEQAGIGYYGGGETVEEAQTPLILEHNGNEIAFLGCNAKGGAYTPLIKGWPGAVDCRFDDVIPLLNQLDLEGHLTIMTFQHYEYYYFDPNYVLENDFRLVADAGADIVSGSQAHQPHGMEFYNDSVLFYGLGNLFFDQYTISEDTARALITRHVIFDNRHISSEIFTIFFNDFSRPRFLTGEDRRRLLWEVFSASEWGGLSYGQ
jgi:poly-gamma-glutamate synthesis protein (capsule biosynthesis protein)